MPKHSVILIGGGEHASVVADAVRSNPDSFELIGFTDPKPDHATASLVRTPHLGGDDVLVRYPDALAVIAFGISRPVSARREAVGRLASIVGGWATVVHRDARVATDAVIGEGTVVLAGAVVQVGVRIGAHSVIEGTVLLGHGVSVGDYAMVAGGAVLGGGASVGAGAFLGLGALIRDHCTVGADAFVGMGAIVVSNVAPASRIIPRGIGVPDLASWKSS